MSPDPAIPPAAINVAGLEKRYGTTPAVDGLSFDVAPGEVFGLLGPNGAGKTTTVEILEGYRTPDRGTVRVLGLDPIRDGRALRRRIGVMLQEGGLYPGLKPLELLRLFASYYDDPSDPAQLLDAVGLRETTGTPVRRLSGGQAQRLSLACALIGRPDVVFLDEPTAGMDPHARATTWQLVRDLRDRGVTVLLTTHAMDEAEQLCDRVAIIAGGKLAALGSPAELTRHAVADEIWFAAGPGVDTAELARALHLAPGDVVEERASEYLVRAAGTPTRVADLACFLRDHEITLFALQSGRRTLEEVFLQVTAESGQTS
jgi:ABC-2 type transport system ATP-binding protein